VAPAATPKVKRTRRTKTVQAAAPATKAADPTSKGGSIGTVVDINRAATRRHGGRQESDDKIVGMGDHTPAFLLR